MQPKAKEGIRLSGTKNEFADVMIITFPTNESTLVSNLKLMKREHSIDLNELLKDIQHTGTIIEGKLIYYYSSIRKLYIFCGRHPLPPNSTISANEFLQIESRYQVEIGLRDPSIDQPPTMTVEEKEQENTTADTLNKLKDLLKPRSRRIGTVVDLIQSWRNLCIDGSLDTSPGICKRITMQEASKRLGISKGALSNLYFLIRDANQYGFDFQKHRNDPFVVLRTFVQKHNEDTETLKKFSEKNETEQNTNETTVKDELSSKSKEALLNKEQGVGDEFTRSLSKIEQNAIGTRLGFDYQRHIRFFVNDKKGKYVPEEDGLELINEENNVMNGLEDEERPFLSE